MQRIAGGRLRRDRLRDRDARGRGARGALLLPHRRSAVLRHATIATAVALAERSDADAIVFDTPVGDIRIEIERGAGGIRAAFTSAPTSVRALDPDDRDAILCCSASAATSSTRRCHRASPMRAISPVIVLSDRTRFDAFTFDPHRVRALMDARGWPATITVAHRVADDRFTCATCSPSGGSPRTPPPAPRPRTGRLPARARRRARAARIAIEQGLHVGRPACSSSTFRRRGASASPASPCDDGRHPPRRYRRS